MISPRESLLKNCSDRESDTTYLGLAVQVCNIYQLDTCDLSNKCPTGKKRKITRKKMANQRKKLKMRYGNIRVYFFFFIVKSDKYCAEKCRCLHSVNILTHDMNRLAAFSTIFSTFLYIFVQKQQRGCLTLSRHFYREPIFACFRSLKFITKLIANQWSIMIEGPRLTSIISSAMMEGQFDWHVFTMISKLMAHSPALRMILVRAKQSFIIHVSNYFSKTVLQESKCTIRLAVFCY